jgi:hypothetical protein
VQIDSEIDKQQPVILVLSEKPQQECLFSENRAVHSIGSLGSKHRIFPAQPQQVAVQR